MAEGAIHNASFRARTWKLVVVSIPMRPSIPETLDSTGMKGKD